MRFLRRSRFYTWDQMRHALTGAGQFAHAEPIDLFLALEALWEDERPEDSFSCEVVPMGLFEADRDQNAVAREVFTGAAVEWLEARFGRLCPLCFAIQMGGEIHDYYEEEEELGAKFFNFICPSWLASVDNMCGYPEFSPYPICTACLRTIARSGAITGGATAEDFVAAAGCLLGNASFRRRIGRNAKRPVRFDPRRPEVALRPPGAPLMRRYGA